VLVRNGDEIVQRGYTTIIIIIIIIHIHIMLIT